MNVACSITRRAVVLASFISDTRRAMDIAVAVVAFIFNTRRAMELHSPS